MEKLLSLLFVCLLAFSSCNKEKEVPLTKQEIKQKVDSITTIRMKELDDMAHRDLQHRIKIEVKIKVDSMVREQKMKSDSIRSRNTPPPADTTKQ